MNISRVLALPLLAMIAASARPAPTPSYDVIIRGGTVYDGTGGKPFIADVAV